MTSARAFTGISDVGSFISEVSLAPAQLKIPNEVPLPSDSALIFLKELSEHDFKHIQFEDLLATFDESGNEVGKYKVTVKEAEKLGYSCYLVEADSHGMIEGISCGTSVKSYIAPNLETIYQEHQEYVKLQNQPLLRKTEIKRSSAGYEVKKNVSQGAKQEEFQKLFEFGVMEGFISEGANILLQRLLITKGLPACFEALAFDSDTNVSLMSYKNLGEQDQVISNEKVHVIGLERVIHSMTDIPTSWQTFQMLDGHLVSRSQVGSPIAMRVKTVPELIEPDELIEKPVFPKKPLVWEDDMQLYSQYLDSKTVNKADYTLYMRQHPEVKSILSDFVKDLLVNKPENVMEHVQEYFMSISNRILPD